MKRMIECNNLWNERREEQLCDSIFAIGDCVWGKMSAMAVEAVLSAWKCFHCDERSEKAESSIYFKQLLPKHAVSVAASF